MKLYRLVDYRPHEDFAVVRGLIWALALSLLFFWAPFMLWMLSMRSF